GDVAGVIAVEAAALGGGGQAAAGGRVHLHVAVPDVAHGHGGDAVAGGVAHARDGADVLLAGAAHGGGGAADAFGGPPDTCIGGGAEAEGRGADGGAGGPGLEEVTAVDVCLLHESGPHEKRNAGEKRLRWGCFTVGSGAASRFEAGRQGSGPVML